LLDQLEADGIHLSSRQMMTFSTGSIFSGSVSSESISVRPIAPNLWLGASCHSVEELKKAESLCCDYASLSPILQTSSHPNADPIGWPLFSEFVESINLPVYALGGLSITDLDMARSQGAQGVSGISEFWSHNNRHNNLLR
ncbi:MAG: thiamine phosphate synthase, partial [Pseudomonadales bacterium]|nr:thiamine phosphate synthase [Pseudomonadales bacterium]